MVVNLGWSGGQKLNSILSNSRTRVQILMPTDPWFCIGTSHNVDTWASLFVLCCESCTERCTITKPLKTVKIILITTYNWIGYRLPYKVKDESYWNIIECDQDTTLTWTKWTVGRTGQNFSRQLSRRKNSCIATRLDSEVTMFLFQLTQYGVIWLPSFFSYLVR